MNGLKHGQGNYVEADKCCYKGDWKANKMEGRGVCKWLDGRKYDGEWKNNLMHGKGVYTWKDGRKYVGKYFNDKR